MSMRDFANHIIAVAKENDIKISNLQLQKVMFFTLGTHIRQNNGITELAKEIYSAEKFSKWRYGPVVESVYFNYSHYGSDNFSQEQGQKSEKYDELNEIIISLLKKEPFQLVRVSHMLPSWKNYEEDIKSKNWVDPYTLEEIEKDFTNA